MMRVTYKPAGLTAQQMAKFLMSHYSATVNETVRNEYRKRALAMLEADCEPGYAKEVRRLMESEYKKLTSI